jgi:hypothetical protein
MQPPAGKIRGRLGVAEAMREKKHNRSLDHDGSEMVRNALDYLRQRSLHRVGWGSARVAMRRGHSGEPFHPPDGHRVTGKR